MTFRRNWPLYLGVFLVSGSTTMLEIALTRVFSVSLWYQFGFMIISTALLGFGASGTYLAVKKGAAHRRPAGQACRRAVLYSISILVAFAIMTRIPLDPLKPVAPGTTNPAAATVELVAWLALYYAIIIVPFFFAGLTIGTAISAWAKEIGQRLLRRSAGRRAGRAGRRACALRAARTGRGRVIQRRGRARHARVQPLAAPVDGRSQSRKACAMPRGPLPVTRSRCWRWCCPTRPTFSPCTSRPRSP